MKIVVLILFSIAFVAIIDAKAFERLANDGQILSPDGCYIPGIILEIFGPLYDVQEQQSSKYSAGYVQIMRNLLIDTDTALITKDSSYLLLTLKVYRNFFEALLPLIHGKLYRMYFKSLQLGKPELESLENGYIDWCGINKQFSINANDLNDAL